MPEEYPVYGGIKYTEPCLKATFHDGVRDIILVYQNYELIEGANQELIIHLSDEIYPFSVDLHYVLIESHDLIKRWVTVANKGDESIILERVFSAQYHLPTGSDYFLSHLYGRWLNEFQLQREPLTPGSKVLESRRITSSHHHNPWFAIDAEPANEDHGAVWFGVLVWSGNWKLIAEVTERHTVQINFGINDWDFSWQLTRGEKMVTPHSLVGFTPNGLGEMKRRLHDYVRDEVLPHRHQLHKVIYNSWEATQFNVDERSQISLAEIAARIGVELFVMDDGWFSNRDNDHAGLGDWFPSDRKFPNGLGGLIRRVNELGMEFGLWIEPEMVSPNSALYRKHPDWVIHFPTRRRSEVRNQLILNCANAAVRDYIINVISKLLSENNIRFIKWDMNRNISEPGWDGAPGESRELWVRYVEGLYDVWGELRKRFPEIIWQSCSSGGGRADYGILKFADQVWVSDNTEATARLVIQEGYSYAYPAITMESWVTDVNQDMVSLAFRFHTSMCGSLGIGANLLNWDETQLQFAAKYVQLYKTIRPIIQLGDQYWLRSPSKSRFSAVQYMDKEKKEGVLFAFRTQIPEPYQLPSIYLRGLDPNGEYKIEEERVNRSGNGWMEAGLQLRLNNMHSVVKRITRVR
jgi:alpha-galactosidase